jgi:DNA polymerase-1
MADPGWSLIKADLSQAEFRIVAWLANIGHVIRKYAEDPNWDVHRWVASLIYKCTEDGVTKEQRGVAKNGVYGGNYKMHYVTAARTYKLVLELAKFVLETYRRVIPEIPRWWNTVDDTIRSTRTIVNPFGRKRIFFGRVDDDMFRAAYSHSAQSIVADLVDRAVILADEYFDPSECHLLLQVHDEMVMHCRNEHVPYYMKMLVEFMEFPLYFPGIEQPLIVPAEATVGPNWYDQTSLEKWNELQNVARSSHAQLA